MPFAELGDECTCEWVTRFGWVQAGLAVEDLEVRTEVAPQGWVPLRVMKLAEARGRLPAVLFMHATGEQHGLPWRHGCAEQLHGRAEAHQR